MAKTLQAKIEKLCADPVEYKKVINKIVEQMAKIDKMVKPEMVDKYNEQVEKVFKTVAQNLSTKKFLCQILLKH